MKHITILCNTTFIYFEYVQIGPFQKEVSDLGSIIFSYTD